jgi:serine/threonine protein kinase
MFQAMGMQQGGTASALPRNPHLSVASIQSSGPVVFKRRAVEEAEGQQKIIEEKLRKLGLPTTGYEFKELIGKGAYGRVYKSLHKRTGNIVAVKVLETDAMDFESGGPNQDANMEDALKEINILQRLQQSKAINVNLFYEAFQVHSQLWIVSEYCPGGSVTTLVSSRES